MFADVYDRAARRGLSPQQVDEMEVWQCAAALGVGVTPVEQQDPRRGGARTVRPGAADPVGDRAALHARQRAEARARFDEDKARRAAARV